MEKVGTGTQTSYVVALYTKMAPEALEPLLVDNLSKISKRGNGIFRLDFCTSFLLLTLADHGAPMSLIVYC